MSSPSQVAGKVVLFIGQECDHWQVADFVATARQARALGIDTIAPRRANGEIKLYGDASNLAEEHRAVNSVGCGYLPFSYCYGPKFGQNQIDQECAILHEMMDTLGFACADLEAEWNNQEAATKRFVGNMMHINGLLYLTTWADPLQQGWQNITRLLEPCVDAWIPQQYDDWLAAQNYTLVSLGEKNIEPAIDLSQEFGTNHPANIAQAAKSNGANTVWLWEYGMIQTARQSVQAISQIMNRGAATSIPLPPQQTIYMVRSGDSLSAIGERFHMDWHQIYEANKQVIGNNPDLIYPGQKLVIP